jgi:glyceraldehyde 3-phosphate dehydrogenase
MTTVHATTSTQMTTDGPSKKRLERRHVASCTLSIFYRSCKSSRKSYSELNGKLTGMAFRVPTTVCSRFNWRNFLRRDYGCVENASRNNNGILGFTEDLVVSQDFVV